jgi:hypothetical protein
MSRGRVGEERGGKEMDRCPLTVGACIPHLVYLLPSPYPWLVVPSPLGCSVRFAVCLVVEIVRATLLF